MPDPCIFYGAWRTFHDVAAGINNGHSAPVGSLLGGGRGGGGAGLGHLQRRRLRAVGAAVYVALRLD